MSSVIPEPNAATPPADTSVAVPAASGAQTPEGYVPAADFEKLELQRRGFQADLEKTKQELAALRAAAPAPATPAADPGTDLSAFRTQLLGEVGGVIALQSTAAALRTDPNYKYADPALFSPEALAKYGSADALKLAVMEDHSRVATAVAAGVTEREAQLRDQLGDKFPSLGTPAGGATPPGDPTPQQLASMTLAQLTELEEKDPGVIERVTTRSAT